MIKINETQMIKIVIVVLVLVMIVVIYDAFSKLKNKELEYKDKIEILEENIFDLEVENAKLMDVIYEEGDGDLNRKYMKMLDEEDDTIERWDDIDESKC